MKCIINKNTRECVNVFNDETSWIDHGEFVLAPRSDGNVGWIFGNDGEWIIPEPITINKTPDELWEDIKAKRDGLLRNSDFSVLPDVPIDNAKKQEWIVYRQMLRDLPELYTNPDDVIWPTAPQ